MGIELTAYSIGDVPEYLAEEGLEQAQYYFDINDLEPQDCFEASEQNPRSTFGQHWSTACLKANLILKGNRLYDNSLICLEIDIPA
ncbi:MAG: hypothetical protein COA86_14355 [Kangiella sp.]|nr:MAG: hypothetical protein COA86_14355 [Kangiella sp.]